MLINVVCEHFNFSSGAVARRTKAAKVPSILKLSRYAEEDKKSKMLKVTHIVQLNMTEQYFTEKLPFTKQMSRIKPHENEILAT